MRGKDFDAAAMEQARRYLEEGRETFRCDTFGSEDFWGGKLKLHEAIAGEKLGGKGPGLSPKKALELGLKVDVNAIPKDVAGALNRGEVDLADPASTLVLLKANAGRAHLGSSRPRLVEAAPMFSGQTTSEENLKRLKVHDGVKGSVFARNIGNARMIAVADDSTA
ncbi:hypothetical protein [Rhizobium mongolense]|nr:hypothetical protein [Rhizobium mongolense]